MNRTARRVWRKKLWKSRTPRFPLLTASLAGAAAFVLLAVVELVGGFALGVADLALGDIDVDLLALLGLLRRVHRAGRGDDLTAGRSCRRCAEGFVLGRRLCGVLGR